MRIAPRRRDESRASARRSGRLCGICWSSLLAGFLDPTVLVAEEGTGALEINGAFEADLQETNAQLVFNQRASIWMLQIRSRREYKKQHGSGFTANLFFSRKFDAASDTYPIRFQYLSSSDTLGGSVIVSGKKRVVFSHDTEGTANFAAFDERVEGSFEFFAYSGSKEPRQKISVKGTFSCPRGEALK